MGWFATKKEKSAQDLWREHYEKQERSELVQTRQSLWGKGSTETSQSGLKINGWLAAGLGFGIGFAAFLMNPSPLMLSLVAVMVFRSWVERRVNFILVLVLGFLGYLFFQQVRESGFGFDPSLWKEALAYGLFSAVVYFVALKGELTSSRRRRGSGSRTDWGSRTGRSTGKWVHPNGSRERGAFGKGALRPAEMAWIALKVLLAMVGLYLSMKMSPSPLFGVVILMVLLLTPARVYKSRNGLIFLLFMAIPLVQTWVPFFEELSANQFQVTLQWEEITLDDLIPLGFFFVFFLIAASREASLGLSSEDDSGFEGDFGGGEGGDGGGD